VGGQERMTKTMTITEVENDLSGVVNGVHHGKTHVIVEKSGVPVAAIISAADLGRFVRYERTRAERFKVLDELREAFKDMPVEEIEREADRAVAEIRGIVAATV
jgi:prevent-host-death family protein